jgi:ferredoxin
LTRSISSPTSPSSRIVRHLAHHCPIVLLEELLMRVVVDFTLCESNALCMAAAPEVFEVRDDDLLYVLKENPPEELRRKVEAAARVCPKQAIRIED